MMKFIYKLRNSLCIQIDPYPFKQQEELNPIVPAETQVINHFSQGLTPEQVEYLYLQASKSLGY